MNWIPERKLLKVIDLVAVGRPAPKAAVIASIRNADPADYAASCIALFSGVDPEGTHITIVKTLHKKAFNS